MHKIKSGLQSSMTKEWIAWAAGLFEGEGCFFTNTIKKKGQTYRYPCAALKMTDEDVIRKFHEVVGVGKVWHKPASKYGYKPAWDWRCHGYEDTNYVFGLFKPYLFSRRELIAGDVLTTKSKKRNPRGSEHGTRAGYRYGCRCVECKLFNTMRARADRAKRKMAH